MTGIMCAMAGSGGVRYAGSATVTVGFYFDGTYSNYGYINILGSPPGSISPANWVNSGLPFYFLYWSSFGFVTFQVTGLAPNSGWDTMNIAGTNYSRSAANYSNNGTETAWTWPDVPSNPFGTTTGATRAVSWS
jgi:hypothetical protein